MTNLADAVPTPTPELPAESREQWVSQEATEPTLHQDAALTPVPEDEPDSPVAPVVTSTTQSAVETPPEAPRPTQENQTPSADDPLAQTLHFWESYNPNTDALTLPLGDTSGSEHAHAPAPPGENSGTGAPPPSTPTGGSAPEVGATGNGNGAPTDGKPAIAADTALSPSDFESLSETSAAQHAALSAPHGQLSVLPLAPTAATPFASATPAPTTAPGNSSALVVPVASKGNLTSSPDPTFAYTQGVSSSYTLATFYDSNTTVYSGSATIDWGDGHSDTNSLMGMNGTFNVSAAHSYAAAGSFPITITFTNADGTLTTGDTAAVSAAASPTSTALTSSLNPSMLGQTVTFTATVTGSGGTPTGSVNFKENGYSMGTAPLVNGSASVSTPSLGVGSDAITADYSGDSNYAASSAGLTQSVNQPSPIVLSISDQSNLEGDSASVQATALSIVGAGLSGLTYCLAGAPSGLSIDPNSGLITGTIGAGTAQLAPYVATVTASGNTGSDSGSFEWNVAPCISVDVIDGQTNIEGDTVALSVQASAPGGSTLTYGASGLPAGLTIDASSGEISGTVASGAAAAGPYQTTVTASAGAYSGRTTFAWTITADTISFTTPGNQSSVEENTVSLQLSASDSASGATLSYSAAGLPSGLAIDSGTGLISGTVAQGDAAAGPYSVTVTAADGTFSNNLTFSWTVTTKTLTLTNPGDQFGNGGDTVSLQLSASDTSGRTPTYSASGLPDGLTINSTTGLISGAIAASAIAQGLYSPSVTATDGVNSDSQSFSWFVSSPVTVTAPADQQNIVGDAVSLQVTASSANSTALAYSATGLPSGLSINSSTGLISGTISSNASGASPFTATVTASDATYNNGATFTWTVLASAPTPTNPITIANPGNQTNAVGDDPSLEISASDANGGALTYSATGLPSELGIDPDTGIISGFLDGNVPAGVYNATVSATDGTFTQSVSFNWTINALVPPIQAPWLAPPGLQNSTVNSSPSLQIQGGDWNGLTVTYSATGLPAGLSISSTTGQIYGTLSSTASSSQVTVTDSNGTLSNSQTFTWNVVSGPYAPQITLSINATPDHRDDVLFVNPAQAVPVLVNLTGAGPGVHTVTIAIPSGLSQLDRTVLKMVNGQSVTIMLTALQASAVEDDVLLVAQVDGQIAGQGRETNEHPTLPQHIRAADTPTGMKDRIPDVNPTSFQVVLSVALGGSGESVILKVNGQSSATGTVNFVGTNYKESAELTVTASTNFGLVGVTQTQPTQDGLAGNADKLQLVAQVGGIQFVMANRFAAAAIPIAVIASNAKKYSALGTPASIKWFFGVQYTITFQSDSGKEEDLAKVYIIEDLEKPFSAGLFNDIPLKKQTVWLLAIPPRGAGFYDFNGLNGLDTLTQDDARTTLHFGLKDGKGADQKNEHQFWRFYDSRTEKQPIKPEDGHAIKNSGFVIYTFSDPKPAALRIERQALTVSADILPGTVAESAEGEQKVVIK